jgi:hypothetical protein
VTTLHHILPVRNVLGMIFSMCSLMLRIKWCSWIAVYCSCVSFANTKYNDDTKQIMSSFMLRQAQQTNTAE